MSGPELTKGFRNLEPLNPGICEWCGVDVPPGHATCSLSHEALLRRLEAEQGLKLIRTLKLWRKHSGRKGTPGEGQFATVTKVVDGFLRNDRERREAAGAARRRKEAAATEEKPRKPSADAAPGELPY